jgi:hypothetical protein
MSSRSSISMIYNSRTLMNGFLIDLMIHIHCRRDAEFDALIHGTFSTFSPPEIAGQQRLLPPRPCRGMNSVVA